MSGRNHTLALGEAFHRLKRTSLLLSVILIASFVPGVTTAGASVAAWVSLTGVEPNFVRALLYAGALYYFVGFVLEFILEARNQRADAESLEIAAFGRVVADWREELRVRLAEFKSTDKDSFVGKDRLTQQIEGLSARLDLDAIGSQVEQGVLRSLRNEEGRRLLDLIVTSTSAADRADAEERLRKLFIDFSAGDPGLYRSTIEQCRGSLENTRLAVENFQYAFQEKLKGIEGMHRQLSGISRQLFTARWAHFFGWELLGAALPFALATFLVLSKLQGGAIWDETVRMLTPSSLSTQVEVERASTSAKQALSK